MERPDVPKGEALRFSTKIFLSEISFFLSELPFDGLIDSYPLINSVPCRYSTL